MIKSVSVLSVLSILVICVFAFVGGCQGCGASIPDSPDGTVSVVANEIEKAHPQIVWQALPQSYQNDVNSLVRQTAGKFDGELWDKGVSVLKKATDVARDKKDFLLATPMFGQLQVDKGKLSENWDAVTGIMEIIVESELASIDKLKAFDGDKFLSGTGSRLMEKGKELRKLAPEDAPTSFAGLKVEKVSESENSATLKVTLDKKVETVEMTKVEGRWIPADMAENWKSMIEEAKKSVDDMSPEEMTKRKPQILVMLAGVESGLDQLNKTQTQSEFDAVFQGLFMGMLPR